MQRTWSKAAEDKLRALYGRAPLPRISFLLKRTEKAVRSRAKVLGLTTGKVQRWSEGEHELLRLEYPNGSVAHLEKLFKRSIHKIYARANQLGIHRSAEYMASPAACRLRRGEHVGKAFQYPKGHVPANKGLRRPGYAPGRMASTMFKKREPHECRNYLPIGSEKLDADGYLVRKVTDDRAIVPARRWVAVHRLIWIEAHGPIPPGHIAIFKDGDKTHIALGNIELMTLADNARRNVMWRKYPKELADVLRLKGVVNRAINKRLGKPERKEKNLERREIARRTIRNARRASRQGEPDGHRSGEGRRAGR